MNVRVAGADPPGLRVALLSEGCYPYVTGGVSTWCQQLISGLPEHRFDVVSITAGDHEQPRFTMPDNVDQLRPVPLWGWVPDPRPLASHATRTFLTTFRPFIDTLVDQDADQQVFDVALRELFDLAQRLDLNAAMRSHEAALVVGDAWARFEGAPLSVHDSLATLELMEHVLRPLSAEPVRADLCHAVSNGLPSMLALTSKWSHGTPFMMSEHGVYLRERYLAFRTLHCPWPVKRVVLAFFRRLTATAYSQADLIAPVNVYNQRWQVVHGADPDSIMTAFNGVDASKFPQVEGEPEVPTVVWVGRVDPLKDLETLVDAFAHVRRAVPEARLRLFGPTPAGNERYERRVRERIAEHDLGDAVTFEGPVSPVSDAYAAGHVVALSSISEGLPYTVIEAMMCGRATVSTDAGGVHEVVGDAGLLAPVRDSEAFGSALVEVLTDHERRRALGEAGRARALDYFRLEQMIGRYRDAYRMLTEPAPTRPARELPTVVVPTVGADTLDGEDFIAVVRSLTAGSA